MCLCQIISNNPSQLQVEISKQFSVPALLRCYAFPNSFSCSCHRNGVGSHEKPGGWSPLHILIRSKSNSLGRSQKQRTQLAVNASKKLRVSQRNHFAGENACLQCSTDMNVIGLSFKLSIVQISNTFKLVSPLPMNSAFKNTSDNKQNQILKQ